MYRRAAVAVHASLLKSLTGLLKPRQGKIVFRGKDITGRLPHEIIRTGIASVPEGRELFGEMTVADNLVLGTYSLSREKRNRMVDERLGMIFDLFPVLKTRLKQKSETLSGGEQQMLALGRALMADPSLLALDEPSLGLAPMLVSLIMKLLRRICLERRITILLVEQNARAALKIADYVYLIERGAVVLEGPSSEVIASPIIQSAYLGA